jgi:Ca-activated chloride channel family protein
VVNLEAGFNRFEHTLQLDEEGVFTFQADISATAGDDRQLQNNSLSAVTQAYPPPRILVVSNNAGEQGIPFASQLGDAGFQADTIVPAELSTRLSDLEPYDGMVLLNISAEELELDQMIAVQEFARSMGRGVLVTGGRSSYTLGKYEGTPLADLLPLTMEPPPREERPPVALLLIIDRSGSMMEQRGDEPTRLTMAKEAAIRATEILGPEDLIGVLMFDNRFEWVVPFQPVNDGAELLQIQENISRIPAGGGTRILEALETGIPALIEQQTANSRHIVLLTDGKSFDGLKTIEDYNAIVDDAVDATITLSTIAIGQGADQELLTYLAERGLGRYHFAASPEELPALTISESDILRSDVLQEGDFEVAVFDRHPIIRGFFRTGDENSEPLPLGTYLALAPKEQAEIALQVGPDDALLSVWGYGLGRVAAWTSDIGAEWATDWRDWSEVGRFWGQVVGYTLPAPDLPTGLQLDTVLDQDGTTTLVAESFTTTGQPIDLARTQAALILPDSEERSFTLGQTAPGRYERQVLLPETGAYSYSVAQTQAGTELNRNAQSGFVQPYVAEYALPPAGAGDPLLRRLAELTGGEVLAPGDLPATLRAALEVPEAEPPTELWPWLLLVALLLWPIEIALRRWGRLRIQ